MSLLARQDKAAGELVHAIDLLTGFRLNEKTKATLMRIAAGHERRTVALITQAHANLLECAYPPKFDTPLIPDMAVRIAVQEALQARPPADAMMPPPMIGPSGTVLPFIPPPPVPHEPPAAQPPFPPPGAWERFCQWFCDRTGYVRKV